MHEDSSALDHPSATALVAHTDGHLDLDARRAVDAHLLECADCRQAVADLAALDARMGYASPLDLNGSAPAVDDLQALSGRTREVLGTAAPVHLAGRTIPWRRIAAAAVLLLSATLVLSHLLRSPSLELGVRGFAEPARGNLRSEASERVHFEVTLPRASYLSIWRMDAPGGVSLAFGPLEFELLGGSGPLPAAEAQRVPEDPLFDLEVDAQTASWFFLQFSERPMTDAEISELRRELNRDREGPAADRAASILEMLRAHSDRTLVVASGDLNRS